jgi:hypothetical protein
MCRGLRFVGKEQDNLSDEKLRLRDANYRNWKLIYRGQIHMGTQHRVRLYVFGRKGNLRNDWQVQQEVQRGDKVFAENHRNSLIHIDVLGQKPFNWALSVSFRDKVEKGQKIDFRYFWEGEITLWAHDWLRSNQKGLVLTVV